MKQLPLVGLSPQDKHFNANAIQIVNQSARCDEIDSKLSERMQPKSSIYDGVSFESSHASGEFKFV